MADGEADRLLAGRLRWRCRRGMKELDVLLERYLDRDLPRAGAEERRLFERLLETPDPLLHAWCLGRAAAPDAALAALIGRITAP